MTMIILRQKYFSHGVEYRVLNKLKGIKQTPGAKKFAKENAVAFEKKKRNAVKFVVDTVNNPTSIVKTVVENPLETILTSPIVPGGVLAVPVVNKFQPYRKAVDKFSNLVKKSQVLEELQRVRVLIS